MTKNLTEGAPLPLILNFAAPLFLGNLLQQAYNLFDAAIVGRYLGSDALAAVGASSSVQFLVLGFCIGICTGFGIPFATYFGANKLRSMRRSVFNAIVVAVGFAAVLTVLCTVLCDDILRLLNSDERYFKDAYSYLFIIFLGIPFTIFYNFISGMLRAVGDSRTPFIFLAVSTVLNILLDLLLIVVFDAGVAGAAVATVASQGLSAFSCLVYTVKRQPVLRIKRSEMRLNMKDVANHFMMGIPMGLQFSITAIGSMYMQSAINALGAVYTTGFTAALKIKSLMFSPSDALAAAISVFASQNVGAGRVDRARTGIGKGLVIGIIWGIIAGLIMIFGGRVISMMFIRPTDIPELDAAGKYLYCLGFFMWLIPILNITRMSTQGLGFSGRTIFAGVAEMAARVGMVKIFVPSYGFTAICFCDQAAWILAVMYTLPMCFYCLKKVEKRLSSAQTA